jgi:eukaryotic translation initiation factor 2C
MNMKPCVDITQPSRQDSVDTAIRNIHRHSAQVLAQQGLVGKQLELLIVILPDNNVPYGNPYGKLFKLILKLMSHDFNF